MPFKDPTVRREYLRKYRVTPEAKAKQRAHYAENREAMLAKVEEYRERNKDKLRIAARANYLKNRDKILAADKVRYDLHRDEGTRALRLEKLRAWHEAHPGKVKEYNRRNWLKRSYGLMPEDYDVMLEARGPNCPLCLAEAPPVVDHCHSTHFVRGLPCNKCNSALGMTKDDPATLRRMAAYLEQATVARLFS